jgi:Fe-S oxidoreductase
VLLAPPQIYSAGLETPGQLSPDTAIEAAVLAGDDPGDASTHFGAGTLGDLTWKDGLEALSCTECGRCTDHCPAAAAGQPLRPGDVIQSLRRAVQRGDLSMPLIPDVSLEETVWRCTTCLACETACPLRITFVDRFVRQRRWLVENEGKVPPSFARVLRGLENHDNPWQLPRRDRDASARPLAVPRFNAAEHDYLLFVGCAASHDESAQQSHPALVSLLRHAGVRFGGLGADEPCCGELARRLGSESTFLSMSQRVIEQFRNLGVRRIITACPHCTNTFAREYPQFGADFTVVPCCVSRPVLRRPVPRHHRCSAADSPGHSRTRCDRSAAFRRWDRLLRCGRWWIFFRI